MINYKLEFKCFLVFFIFLTIMLLFKIQIYKYQLEDMSSLNKNLKKQRIEALNKLGLTKDFIKFYSDLYEYVRNGYKNPKFSNKTYVFKTKEVNISICVIGKNENKYIREFAEYYHLLGVDKIFLYDNNELNGEYFETMVKDYIKINYIEIIDVRGLSSIQIPVYNHCYHKNKNIFNWIGFVDIDEYLYIENKETIKNYLYNNKFDKCQALLFNWILYNDNGLLKYNNRNVIERFTNPSIKLNQSKTFVRGYIKDLIMPSTHLPGINVFSFCNSNGQIIYPKNFIGNEFEFQPKAYIKHFFTKTAEEFCEKLKKGNAHFHKHNPEYLKVLRQKIELFYKINQITKEKINILENCINITNKIQSKNILFCTLI